MARVTITNTRTTAYVVPAPIRKRLAAGETRVFDGVFIPDLERSASFQTAMANGTFTAVIAQDPNVPDTFETGSQSVTPITDNTVSTAKIVDLAVTTGKINDLAVTTGKLNDLAVTTGKLNDLAVTTGKLNDLGVTAGKIASDAVTTAKILAKNVTSAKINMFLSAVITGTGIAQNTAHGLAAVPALVAVIPVGGHDGAGAAGIQFPTITEGAHDGTNVIVTASTGSKYKVLAFA